MNADKCAVPKCYSTATTGIPFPKEPELLEQWLRSLDIVKYVPTEHSFVCLDHFGNNIFLDNITDSDLASSLEELPVPTLNGKVLENVDNSTNLTCRLCLESVTNKDYVDIFDKFNQDIKLSTVIVECIPALNIVESDFLSKVICPKCFKMVERFFYFKNACIQADSHQRSLLRASPENKRKLESGTSENHKKSRPDKDLKLHNVEELMKVLEGKLTDEMKSAENIIIEVQSDEENYEMKQDLNVIRVGADEVKLPKGIIVNCCQSRTGAVNNVEVVKGGIESYEYCLADNYLFEFRLRKGNILHLRCLDSKCKSVAQQAFESGTSSTEITLLAEHNHPPPTKSDRKKQMFLHMMRKKMQSDKTLNFRSVYEQFSLNDPEIRKLVPLKTIINQLCCQQMSVTPQISSFDQFFDLIETDEFQKLHFTHSDVQFYQDKLHNTEDNSKAIVFANKETINRISDSKLMYVDASFKIETKEPFQYHLVSVLVWITDSYYPIMFALVNEASQGIYKAIFENLHNNLAPKLRPAEIVTDYQASLYYALGETYSESHIGGSVFYYTQSLYKKICSLNQSRELETNSCFRNIYHMLLMLPLLPVNTIVDGLNNIEAQATEMGQSEQTKAIFDHVRNLWMNQVTPDLFCVHRLENRINENVIAPFKKLRDFLMLSKGKMQKQHITIFSVIEKLIELESFLQNVYSALSKKSFARDLSSSQKKNVIRAWQFIETHPKININYFFTKVLGYIKCMENQLWIWGFYRYTGEADNNLINAADFSIINEQELDHNYEATYNQEVIVMDTKEEFVVKESELLM